MWKIFRQATKPAEDSTSFLAEAELMDQAIAPLRNMKPSQKVTIQMGQAELPAPKYLDWESVRMVLGCDLATIALVCGYQEADRDTKEAIAAGFMLAPIVTPDAVDKLRQFPQEARSLMMTLLPTFVSMTKTQPNKDYALLSPQVLHQYDEEMGTDYEERAKTILLRFADVFLNAKGLSSEEKSRVFDRVQTLIGADTMPESMTINRKTIP